MSNDQEVFSFDLNESLYFEKGQEVAEMMGISLDPEISIQPFNEYISIRGVIELRGEYVKTNDVEMEEEDGLEFDDYHSKRYVESVVDTESGATEFSHRFPVEITVPTYRVDDLDDVTVSIESFDYEIPNQSQLKFMSTIAIHGISDQSESSREENSYDGMDFPQPFSLEESADHTFDFDIKQSTQDIIEETESVDYQSAPTLSAGENEEKERWNYKKKSQTLAEFFQKEPEPESSVQESSQYESSIADFSESVDRYESAEIRSNEVKDVSYLSDMFRNDEEERYAKMRVCIVQHKDTIETIADRYQLSTLQIVKQNGLTDENLSEGQLLYIPFKKK